MFNNEELHRIWKLAFYKVLDHKQAITNNKSLTKEQIDFLKYDIQILRSVCDKTGITSTN